MNISKILNLWVEITGVRPNDSVIRIKDLDIHQVNDVIKNSLEYDSTYVTTLMLMESYLKYYLSNRSILLKDIIEDYDTFSSWLDKINLLKNLLFSEEANELKKAFKKSLKQAMFHYQIEDSAISSMLEDEYNLAEIRYSAFRAIRKLDVYQFSNGDPSVQTPVIYEKVFLFHDVNTLLQWMMTIESGIVLALIYDAEQPSSSYFAFAIRNGAKLYLVTDREKMPHPLYKSMSRTRAQGRAFFNRIMQNFFPYSLLDIEVEDDARAYVNSKSTHLTKQGEIEGIPLKDIRKLEPNEILWLVMVFSLLNEKFFKQNYEHKKLSYTAKMMTETDYLTEKARNNGIVLYGYKPLVVEAFTKDSVKTEKVKDAFDYEPTGINDWLIDRYHIPSEALDVLGKTNVLYLQDGKNEKNLPVELKKMSKLSFGDAESLQKDRIFLARYNMAKTINVQLKEEYKKKKDEVIQWYRNAVLNNMPNLLKAVAEGKFIVSQDHDLAYILENGWRKIQPDGNILRIGQLESEEFSFYLLSECKFVGKSSNFNRETCFINDTKSSLIAHFHPSTPSMLADLCGCKISDLPVFLQHWRKENLKVMPSNPILSRVDPMDWAIENPWDKLHFDIRIYLSKRGYNALCKEHGIKK